jgi:hypothetical protein
MSSAFDVSKKGGLFVSFHGMRAIVCTDTELLMVL